MSLYSLFFNLKRKCYAILLSLYEYLPGRHDVVIKFLSAKNLPKRDLNDGTNPYFIAKIDDEIIYTSTILVDTLSPEWKEAEWIVRNIPSNAKLTVFIYDKIVNSFNDHFIGQFEIKNLTKYQTQSAGHAIIGSSNGRFYLIIESTKSNQKLPRYTFDGPCYYSRHDSSAIDNINTYSTWTIQLRQISVFFCPYDRQQWNKHYTIAQTIFGNSPCSLEKQKTLKLAHKILYGRTLKNDKNGRLTTADDLWKLIFSDDPIERFRTRIYTYIIDDHTWKFSETGGGLFTEYASKHAVHANCSESVRYAGQFHPRPKFGWDRWEDEWELVFDNWSGTYAPSRHLLNNLKRLLELNFPGLNVVVYDYKDPLLLESMNKLKLTKRQVKRNSTYLNQFVLNLSTTTTT